MNRSRIRQIAAMMEGHREKMVDLYWEVLDAGEHNNDAAEFCEILADNGIPPIASVPHCLPDAVLTPGYVKKWWSGESAKRTIKRLWGAT